MTAPQPKTTGRFYVVDGKRVHESDYQKSAQKTEQKPTQKSPKKNPGRTA